ncbi:Ger(x)C family spore germination protein [Caenibacillus caldisaponilyticus]|uniref:Ger(x)C family spore germination protein n=1 Tax=Caenibacillus caldisaponilyticus TaxID=1674942 RepID=UPI0009885A62|nr:Ger(x)C family spore germination protein [Caenibacillus caldisaponilyticus]
MAKVKAALAILMLIPVLAACEEPKVIDDIKLAEAIGYDYAGQDKVYGTVATPVYAQTGGSGQVQSMIDSFSVIVSKGVQDRSLLDSESEYPLEIGKLLVVLYGKDLAKRGLYKYADLLNRNPDIGRALNLAIVDGSAGDMLKGQYRSDPLVSIYLSNLIRNNIKRNFPSNDLHDFLYSYYGKGMDPFMPLLERKGDHIKIKGIALFKGDRYVDYIPFGKAMIFKMLFESFRSGSFAIPWKKKEYITFENIGSKVKYHVKNADSPAPLIRVDIHMQGYLRETAVHFTPQKMRILKKKMEQTLEKEGLKMIRQLQTLDVDPLRIGNYVHSYSRHWDPNDWRDRYKNCRFEIHIDFNLAHAGLVE